MRRDGGERRTRAGRWAAAAVALAAVVLPLVPPAVAAPAPEDRRRNGVEGSIGTRVENPDEVAFRQARRFALHQLARTDRRLRPGRFPTVAVGDGPWRTSGTDGWLAGFWPGRLWLAYELDGHRRWARRAAARQAPLAVRQDDTSTHDLGFLMQTSFGRGAELDRSRSDAEVILRSAAALASRYVRTVGAIRSWDGPPGEVTVIIDNLMNLELLFWAADHGGRREWRDLAVQHALTTARWHLRPDGSTFHVVRFDEQSGRLDWRGTVQGLADGSTWARGQSWAVHGFTTAYRESGDPRLLAAARKAAGYAVAHLPADGVPWWDYDAPGTQRDTSAGAVLASGLLDLARVDPDPVQRQAWRTAGLHVLRSLVGPRYLVGGSRGWSVLRHARHSPAYDDVGVTYADYYLLEALQRVQLLPSQRPALRLRHVRSGTDGALQADLGRSRRVSAVSVRWRDGPTVATRFVLQASSDGRRWTTVRGGVSSADTAGFETYDVQDRSARYLRVSPLGDRTTGGPLAVRVRG